MLPFLDAEFRRPGSISPVLPVLSIPLLFFDSYTITFKFCCPTTRVPPIILPRVLAPTLSRYFAVITRAPTDKQLPPQKALSFPKTPSKKFLRYQSRFFAFSLQWILRPRAPVFGVPERSPQTPTALSRYVSRTSTPTSLSPHLFPFPYLFA